MQARTDSESSSTRQVRSNVDQRVDRNRDGRPGETEGIAKTINSDKSISSTKSDDSDARSQRSVRGDRSERTSGSMSERLVLVKPVGVDAERWEHGII